MPKKLREKKEATFGQSIFALLILLFFIGVGGILLKLRIEAMMVSAATVVGIMAWKNGYTWNEIESAISRKLESITPAILIIFAIGTIISTFTFSGSIPMLTYYGVMIMSPKYVLVTGFLACIIFSVITGASWGSAGTIGVAFMGIAEVLDVPLGMTAGAIIAGATFGDKLSPLSETTNLCSGTVGVNIYSHIKSMLWTTLPATIIACLIYFILGNQLNISQETLPPNALALTNELAEVYKFGILLILPFLVILAGAVTKKPPIPTMLLGSLSAIIIGAVYQGYRFADGIQAALFGFNASMIPSLENPSDLMVSLLNRGGVLEMFYVVIIIYCGYSYAAIISKAGFLEKAITPIVNKVKSRASVMCATLFTEFVLLFFSGSSYPAAIIVPEMFKKAFYKVGMGPLALSRTLEDVGTICAAYIPWGSSGVFYATALGVSVWGAGGYGYWYFTGFLTPVIAVILAITGIGIYKLSQHEIEEELAKHEEKMQEL